MCLGTYDRDNRQVLNFDGQLFWWVHDVFLATHFFFFEKVEKGESSEVLITFFFQ